MELHFQTYFCEITSLNLRYLFNTTKLLFGKTQTNKRKGFCFDDFAESKSDWDTDASHIFLLSRFISIKFEFETTGSPLPQEKDMTMATNHLPQSLSTLEENEKQASYSVFMSELLVQSEEVVKIKDRPLFKPLNMKRASKDIIFKSKDIIFRSKDIFKPVNLDQQKTLFKPVAMVRPLPLAVVKPFKKGESFNKPLSEESQLIAAPERENVVSNNPESGAKNENGITMQESNKLSKPSALNVTIPENQCQDCLKVMTTKRSVIESRF